MKRTQVLFLIIGIFLFFISFSINASKAEEGKTSFIIPIDKTMFSQDAVITVRLYNEEQLQQLERISGCTVSFDAQTRTQITHCPAGESNAEINPEEFEYSMDTISDEIIVQGQKVKQGEKFKIMISGKYKDNCNQTSASATGIVESSDPIKLENLDWQATAMACAT